jgi:hypothetical protein
MTTTTTPNPAYRRIQGRTQDGTRATIDLEGIAQGLNVTLRNDAGPADALDIDVQGQATADGVFEVMFHNGPAEQWYDIEVHAGMTGDEIEAALLAAVVASPTKEEIVWVQRLPTFLEIPYQTYFRDEGARIGDAVRVRLDAWSAPA